MGRTYRDKRSKQQSDKLWAQRELARRWGPAKIAEAMAELDDESMEYIANVARRARGKDFRGLRTSGLLPVEGAASARTSAREPERAPGMQPQGSAPQPAQRAQGGSPQRAGIRGTLARIPLPALRRLASHK